MIRSTSPASARTGGADKARIRSLPCARAVRASADDCSNSAAACCCGTGQPEMSAPSRPSRSSKSAIFIVDKTCSRNAATYFVVLREAKAPWQSQYISGAVNGASRPPTGMEKQVPSPEMPGLGDHRGRTGESMRPPTRFPVSAATKLQASRSSVRLAMIRP